jgi:hypothetical protein
MVAMPVTVCVAASHTHTHTAQHSTAQPVLQLLLLLMS